MTLSVHRSKPAVNFTELMDAVEKKHGFDIRDMGGKYSAETRKKDEEYQDAWLEQNGYFGKAYVLNTPEGSNKDWDKDSPEMALRIEINKKMTATGYYKAKPSELIPYQDVWHWLLDRDFCELSNGSYNWLDLSDERLANEDDKIPDYVLKFLKAAREEVEGHEAFDGYELHVWNSW